MAGIAKINGQAVAQAFYGLAPLVIKVTDSGNNFTAASGGGTSPLVEGGYDKMVKAVQTLGSIVWLGAQANGSFTVVVDGASFNAGGDTTNAGAYGILKTLATAVADDVGTAGTIAITTSTVLNGAGTFTFA